MTITTLEEARALVGRTFERDGKRRTVTRIERLSIAPNAAWIRGDVYWKRPGGKEQTKNIWLPYFNEWLRKATEVQQERSTP